MNKHHLLLKYISSCIEESKDEDTYVRDFLNGSLYMNTVSYFWDPIIRKRIIEEYIRNNPDKDNSRLIKEKDSLFGYTDKEVKGQNDLYEGTIGIESVSTFDMGNETKEHILSDTAYRSLGFGYCNICCLYRLDYIERYINNHKYIEYSLNGSMSEFGKYIVIIKDEEEFLRRINKAVNKLGYKYLCGNVIYHKEYRDGKEAKRCNSISLTGDQMIDIEAYKDKIIDKRSCFDKIDEYSYQNEWRIALYRGIKDPNAYILNIGDIKDICEVANASNIKLIINKILSHNPKLGLSDYYGNISRDNLKELFYKLGDNKAQALIKIG